MKHVALIVNKNNNFGLAKDAELLKESWHAWGRAQGHHGLKVSIKDPRESCEAVDVVVSSKSHILYGFHGLKYVS